MGGPGFTTCGPGLLPLGEAWRAVRESGSALPPGFDPGLRGDPAGRPSGAFGRLRLARPDATCTGSRYKLR